MVAGGHYSRNLFITKLARYILEDGSFLSQNNSASEMAKSTLVFLALSALAAQAAVLSPEGTRLIVKVK